MQKKENVEHEAANSAILGMPRPPTELPASGAGAAMIRVIYRGAYNDYIPHHHPATAKFDIKTNRL